MPESAEAPANSVTVVICAYTESRWDTLQRSVSLAAKQLKFHDELLVVIDYNEALLAKCRSTLKQCRVIPNGRSRGLSGARNSATSEARGSVIVFLDDDAVPLDGWLEGLLAPYVEHSVHGVGGRALPRWHARAPRWFPDEFLWVVGCSYLGLPDHAAPIRNLLGANMSFRKTAFDDLGGFVETMGRLGAIPLGCEETEFSIRLTQASPDATLFYEPSSQVEHFISKDRESLKYFVRRCWAEGLSKAEVSRRVGPSSALSTERDYVRRVLVGGIVRGVRQAAAGDAWGAARSAAIALGLAATALGYGVGGLRLAGQNGGRTPK